MDNLSDAEIVARLSALYKIVMSFRKDDDYEVNQDQMDKLCKLYRFFLDAAGSLGGKVDSCKLVPREEHSGVTATFLVFDLYGTQVPAFCEVLKECSAVTIDTVNDSICISCTIPNVFKKKTN